MQWYVTTTTQTLQTVGAALLKLSKLVSSLKLMFLEWI